MPAFTKYFQLQRHARHDRSAWDIARVRVCATMYAWLLVGLTFTPTAGFAAQIQNTSVGDNNGVALDLSGATVTLNRVGNAFTSALAEIAPNSVLTGASAQSFTFDVLPVIATGDDGIDLLAITAPPGYSNLEVTGVSVGGASLDLNCPIPGTGQYCASSGGSGVSVGFGDRISTTLTNIKVSMNADTPSVAGSSDFAATLDDSLTPGIPPQAVAAGDADGEAGDANSITVATAVGGFDPDQSSLAVAPPIVIADGVALSVITATLLDANGQPVPGRSLTFTSDRGSADTVVQPSAPSDADGIVTGTIRSTLAGSATVTATDVADNVELSDRPEVTFTQGEVLNIRKRTMQERALVGDLVEYRIEIRNTVTRDVDLVRIMDLPPPQFKIVSGSVRLNGTALADPIGARPAILDVGTIPALVDANGNGEADPGEPGYALLTYNMIVGAGVRPGTYRNTAIAADVCDDCIVSNESFSELEIATDPLFDLGTVIGKVFDDRNGNGWQDRNEAGVPSAMVVLDDGTYALTDRHGRYHFPAVRPGQRLVKLNLASIAGDTSGTTASTRVLSVTDGLLAKANFGVRYRYQTAAIGQDAQTGVHLTGEERRPAIEVTGSAIANRFVVNGGLFELAGREVRMTSRSVEDVAELVANKLRAPIRFTFSAEKAGQTKSWVLIVRDSAGTELHRIAGASALPDSLEWNGQDNRSLILEAGQTYQYQLEVTYPDGSRSSSASRLFGVNRRSIVALELRGGAFLSGSHELTAAARKLLNEAAVAMRELPDEKIVIAGHTDAVGAEPDNLALSLRRANSALSYLVEQEGLPAAQFLVEGYGETRPLTSNDSAAGREQNRRVEVSGELVEIDRANLNKRTRVTPEVRINGLQQPLDDLGRFRTRLVDTPSVEVRVLGEDGGDNSVSVALPALEIIQPTGELKLSFGQQAEDYSVPARESWTEGQQARFRLVGRTDPGNTVSVNGTALSVHPDGLFASELTLRAGNHVFGILARTPLGVTRISNLKVTVTDRDANGPLIVTAPIPVLAVQLPPEGLPLTGARLAIPGVAEPASQVWINGQEAVIDETGGFVAVADVPMGESLLKIEIRDAEGNTGNLQRKLIRTEQPLFLLAIAEGTVSRLKTSGSIEDAQHDGSAKIVTEGRVAFYMKGRILGKYLITSAFDSGINEFSNLFRDLDATENERLLTNLDPNTLYPVYGDDSTLVYDAQSQGKFYLALESEQLRLMVGNYPLSFSDSELSAYQRTLYGIQASYSSKSKTGDGESGTEIQAFAAELNQAHIRDELRATGGSLYYLSHRDVIEGSEQVTIFVRDQNNDMVLSKVPQTQATDYEIRYQEGRLVFKRPVSSTQAGNTLINRQLLAGNPVYIQVDYETRLSSLSKTAAGARLKQNIGEVLEIGGTVVVDNTESGEYRLTGFDAEARLGEYARVLGEIANSSGIDSLIYQSTDGGLTYTQFAPGGVRKGGALKFATELDLGGMYGKPGQLKAGAYYKRLDPGFLSNGNSQDAGTTSLGLDLSLRLGQRNKILARHDRRKSSLTQAETAQTTMRFDHDRQRLRLSAEIQDRDASDNIGVETATTTAGLSARVNWREGLATTLEHHVSMRGRRDTQTSLATEFSASEDLALHARASSGDRGSAVELGARLKLMGQDVQLSQRVSSDATGGRNLATVLGTSAPFGEDGKVYTEYQWGSIDEYRNLRTLLGLSRSWELSDGLTLRLSGEHSDATDNALDTSRFAFAAGIAYDNKRGLKLSSRNEYRREDGIADRTQVLTSNHLSFSLNSDLTLLGKYLYSETDNPQQLTGLTSFIEGSLGIAYRPVAHDRLNLLARYSYLANAPMQLIDGFSKRESDSHVFSADWSYQFSPWIEWIGKQAMRVKETQLEGDDTFTTHTSLSIQRINLRLPRSFLMGMEYRVMDQREAANANQGWLTELMWEHPSLLRAGIGFNFTDFSDDELSDNDYSVRGWFFRIQGRY